MFSTILTEKIRTFYEKQFTGFLRISGPEEKQWYLYFLLGRIVWAQAGFHDLRRWQRYIALHNPAFFKQVSQPVSVYYEYWNYASVAKLVRRKQFPREVFEKVVEHYIAEVLFDVIQKGTLHTAQTVELLMKTEPREASNMPFIMLESLQSLQRAKQEWEKWSQVGLTKISPDYAPVIENAQALKERIPLSTFQTLSSFANEGGTLRDISVACKQPIIPITKSILPYVSKQLLSLTTLPDLVENVTHGFHLELTVPDGNKEKDKAPDTEQKTAVSTRSEETPEAKESSSEAALPVPTIAKAAPPKETTASNAAVSPEATSTKTSSPKSNSSKATASPESISTKAAPSGAVPPKTALPKTVPAEKASSKAPLSTEALPEATPPKTAPSATTSSGTASPDKNPARAAVLSKTEDPSSELAKSIESKLNESKLASSQQKVGSPSSTASAPKVSPKNSTHSQPKARKKKPPIEKAGKNSNQHLPKIAHIEDSLFDSRMMSAIVEGAGYRYINIPDPLQALPTLIEMKPKLIFLDLVMPMANGFEVCGQIRRMSMFKKTPIIIVTSNRGIIDRLRVKISGASGFMSKPIKEEKVKKILKRHVD